MNCDDLLQLDVFFFVLLFQTCANPALLRRIALYWDYDVSPTLQHILLLYNHRQQRDNAAPLYQRKSATL